MGKFVKLVRNENKKEMKKISTKIFIVVSVFMIMLAVAFTMLMKLMSTWGVDTTDSYWKEIVYDQINSAKNDLARAKERNDIEGQVNAEAMIKVYQYALEKDININGISDNWKVQILNRLIGEEVELGVYKQTGDSQRINEQSEKVDKLYKLIENDDFNGYINLQKDELKEQIDNKTINKEQYDLALEIIELKEKYEIGKTTDNEIMWKIEVVNEIEELKEELRTNFNPYTKKLLSYKEKTELENTVKIDLYRLEKDIAPISNNMGETNYRGYFDMIAESFSMIIVSILVIMIAGGAISTEYSKGTIKFLVMTPYKRWKILFAKLINAVIMMLAFTVMLSILSLLVGNIFFSNNPTAPYLYVQNGEVHELNHTVYTILRFLTEDIDIFIYLLFALMLSVITRNTAVSIGVSIATYLGSSIVMTILNTFVKADWVKFIPFNNLGLTDRIFTNTTTILNQAVSSMTNNVTVTFSLCVLGVTSILMIVTMFDSFNKRDIK